MSYTGYLKELLAPLGVYDLDAPFSGGELDVQGRVLDEVEQELEQISRETDLTQAQDWGLEQLARLFVRRPMAQTPREMRQALAALLRIGGDSFTLRDINDTISGCGIPARVEESGAGAVTVSFPGTAGVPKGFEQLKQIIEDILPVHLTVDYWFWYLTWAELEQKFASWMALEAGKLTWAELETCVD